MEAGVSQSWWQDASKFDIVADDCGSLCNGTLGAMHSHTGNLHNSQIYIVFGVDAAQWTGLVLQWDAAQSSYLYIKLAVRDIVVESEVISDL